MELVCDTLRAMLSWLRTRWHAAAYVIAGLVCAALGGLLFGFPHGIDYGLGAFGLVVVTIAGISLVRIVRKGLAATDGEQDASGTTEPDWLSLGEIEVRIEGRRKRYLARFATVAPAVDGMSREESRIAATLRFLGMPEATVVKLDEDAEAAGTGRQIVQIPNMAIRDAARFGS
jgi:hypothetical protein